MNYKLKGTENELNFNNLEYGQMFIMYDSSLNKNFLAVKVISTGDDACVFLFDDDSCYSWDNRFYRIIRLVNGKFVEE